MEKCPTNIYCTQNDNFLGLSDVEFFSSLSSLSWNPLWMIRVAPMTTGTVVTFFQHPKLVLIRNSGLDHFELFLSFSRDVGIGRGGNVNDEDITCIFLENEDVWFVSVSCDLSALESFTRSLHVRFLYVIGHEKGVLSCKQDVGVLAQVVVALYIFRWSENRTTRNVW